MNLFDRKPQLLDFYQTLIEDSDGLFTPDHIARFQEGANLFCQEQFSIVIAGRFSVGKSLLINRAFLQADVLPYKNEPTTCHPVYIVYGHEKQLVLRDADGHCKVVAQDEDAIKAALTKHVAQYGDDHDRYQIFELSWPDAEMLKNGVVLVDTIGTEDTEERYIQQTYAEMEQAAVVVFLFNMQQAGTQSEQVLIEKYLSNTGKKLFIVLTRADTRDSADQALILQDFRKRLQPFFSAKGIRVEDRVFIASAKTGLGLAELRQCLVDFIANDRFKELFQQHTQQIQHDLQAFHKQVEIQLKDLQDKKTGDEHTLRETLRAIEQLEDDLNRSEQDFNDLKEDMLTEARRTLEYEILNIKNGLWSEIRNIDPDEIKFYIEDVIDKVNKLINRIGNDVQRRIYEELKKRVRQWVGIDTEKLETRFDFMSGFSFMSAVGYAGYAGTASGVALTAYGAAQSLSAYLASVTTGALPGAWSWLVGGSAIAPAAVTVGIPLIAGGALLALASYGIIKTIKSYKDKKRINEVRDEIKGMLSKAEKEISRALEDYINTQVDDHLGRLQKEASRKRQQLQDIINQKNLETLQQQIDHEQVKSRALSSYLNKLQTLMPV